MMTERDAARLQSLSDFQDKIGYRFDDRSLLEEALTHSSYAHELGLTKWNERLEFLGDAVLELETSAVIYKAHPEADEGTMTRLRASLVCEAALAHWARALGLQELLRVGKGQRRNLSDSMIADAMEALIGAVYLDGGAGAAGRFVRSRPEAKAAALDAKSRLQILCQEEGGETPHYDLISREGPEHDPHFKVSVSIRGHLVAQGEGSGRKAAEQAAAAKALEILAAQETKE